MAVDADVPYVVEERTIVAETEDLAVKVFTLAPGQEVPWHYHNNIIDTFYCLEARFPWRRGRRAPSI